MTKYHRKKRRKFKGGDYVFIFLPTDSSKICDAMERSVHLKKEKLFQTVTNKLM